MILSLALGIGANTAIFTILDQILLRGLPVRHPEQLVFFYQPGPVQGRSSTDEGGMPSFSYPMFRDLQKKQTSFAGIAGMRAFAASLSYHNQALPGQIHLVSGNYFELLGMQPAIGRLFTPEDDRTPGGHYVAVLSHSYWTNRLGARPEVLNQPILVNGYSMTIVGVAPKGFHGDTLGRPIDVFVPITMKAQMTPNWDGMEDRKDYWVTLVGRLKPGMTLERAAEEINSPFHAIQQEDAKLLNHPDKMLLDRFLNKRIVLKPGSGGRGGVRQAASTPLALLTGITVFVLLIACANAANLLLAKAAGRRKEIAIRLSIGASRARLIRQLLLESWILSLSGGLLGLLVAQWTLDVLISFIPPTELSGFINSQLDGRVLLYCLAVSLATGLAFGLYPALQATKPDVAPTLKDQLTPVTTGSSRYFRDSLVIAQVALSLMLLVTAGLFASSLVKMTRIDVGFSSDRLMTFSLRPELAKYNRERAVALFEQLEDRLAALPGARMVSAAEIPLIADSNASNSITVEGYTSKGESDRNAYINEIGPAFFATLGIPLVAGREFTRADSMNSPKVAIINQTFAKRYFDTRNPLGRHLGIGSGPGTKTNIEIVGVVKDSKYSQVTNEPRAVYYLPYRQDERLGALFYYVRTAMDAEQFAPLIRREVAKLDPNIPVDRLKTMNAQISESIFAERLLSTFAAAFACLATLLAAIGLYGVLAYTVARRTHEIGIRMALGANRHDIHRLILREVLVMLGIGIGIGSAAAVAANRLFESLLYGVKSTDPAVLLGAAVLLAAVALAAGSLPARKATEVDPMVALRY